MTQPEMFDTHIPDSVSSVKVRTWATETFSATPGGAPRDRSEMLAVLVLAATGDAGASVRLSRSGLGQIQFDDRNRIRALLVHAAVSEQIQVGKSYRESTSDDALWDIETRVNFLWDTLCATREKLSVDAGRIGVRLAPNLPEGLQLDQHQLESLVMYERFGRRILIADDMGLGKTIEALGTILLEPEDAFPVLIVCPATMVPTWKREAATWLVKFIPEIVHVDKKLDLEALRESDRASRLVIVASYHQMTRYWQELLRLKCETLIADESHYQIHWDSQRTRNMMRIRTRAKRRVLLTGTSMPNGRHRELYPQIKILDADAFAYLKAPGQRGDRYPYLKHYCDPKTRFLGKDRRITQYDGRTDEAGLGHTLRRYMVRRTKAEVQLDGLGDLSRYAIEVPLSMRNQMELARIKDEVASETRARGEEIRVELTDKGYPSHAIDKRVRQVMLSETMKRVTRLRQALGSIKATWSVARVRELLDAGHKVLVFAAHRDVARRAAELYEDIRPGQVVWGTGEMSLTQRDHLMKMARDDKCRVAVLTRAYREGLTLIEFDRGVMLERWWVPAEEAQGEARIHRRGQTLDVAWEYLMCRGTIDDAMADLVTWKERGQQDSYGSSEVRVLEWLLGAAT